MLVRLVLFILLAMFVARAFWRLIDGLVEGMRGPASSSRVPHRGVQMARDPVCGTFVVPGEALSIVDGRQRVYFCSAACRDRYRSRSGTGSSGRAEGRTA